MNGGPEGGSSSSTASTVTTVMTVSWFSNTCGSYPSASLGGVSFTSSIVTLTMAVPVRGGSPVERAAIFNPLITIMQMGYTRLGTFRVNPSITIHHSKLLWLLKYDHFMYFHIIIEIIRQTAQLLQTIKSQTIEYFLDRCTKPIRKYQKYILISFHTQSYCWALKWSSSKWWRIK